MASTGRPGQASNLWLKFETPAFQRRKNCRERQGETEGSRERTLQGFSILLIEMREKPSQLTEGLTLGTSSRIEKISSAHHFYFLVFFLGQGPSSYYGGGHRRGGFPGSSSTTATLRGEIVEGRRIFEFDSYRDGQLFRFNVPLDTTAAIWRFYPNVTFGCDAGTISV